MSNDGKKALTPKLRFPEFRESWQQVPLKSLATLISDRVGDGDCVPYTVTSGVGLISQDEKFGRTIAGNSLKNYIRLQKNDFAYNKSATKAYPEGYIARYVDDAKAAVPNSIFTCFRPDTNKINPIFLDFLFAGNLHGRWLRKFLTIGARAHGSLNVSDDDLMALPVPMPAGRLAHAEQQKIADCLTSLEELIAAQGRKVDALKAHKKGLMQQLFPREGETVPRLRFPEFRDAPAWTTATIGDIFETTSGGTPDRTKRAYWNGSIPWITTSLIDFNVITSAEEFITDEGLRNSSAKILPRKSVLIALIGQGKTRGKVALLDFEASTNQNCGAILPNDAVAPNFTFLNLCGRYEEIRGLSNGPGQGSLSQGLIRTLPFCFPKDKAEQQRIADCLSALDAQIIAESRKLDALKLHKRGLMQQLFPAPEGGGA